MLKQVMKNSVRLEEEANEADQESTRETDLRLMWCHALRIRLYVLRIPKKGISPIILFWGWD